MKDDLIEAYIEPAYNWQEWRSQNVSSLNFTWELREFSPERMRIKLNFPDPTAISPFPRYDKLMIKIADVAALFDNIEKSSARRLEHSEFKIEFEKGIQRQMYDNPLGRDTVQLLYDMRIILVTLFVVTFILAFVFKSPNDRVYIMLLELYLMCNFAIFHVTLPGNVEIASTIMKPLVSFNIFKVLDENGWNNNWGKDDSIVYSETELEFLGQRATYGYNSYNVMFNLQTIGIFMALYLIKLLVVSLLYCCSKCKLSGDKTRQKTSHYHALLLDQVIYNDLLYICIRCFLEIVIALWIVCETPTENIDFTWENWLVFGLTFVPVAFCVPIVYFFIYRETSQLRKNQ
jgi:tetrahydromethanopterin S-methyltransferase subunit G